MSSICMQIKEEYRNANIGKKDTEIQKKMVKIKIRKK